MTTMKDSLETDIGESVAAEFRAAGSKRVEATAAPKSVGVPHSGTPLRVKYLTEAARLTSGDRDKEYGNPAENMADIAEMWSLYLKQKYGSGLPGTGYSAPIKPEDVPMMLSLMKVCRTYKPTAKADTYIDGACYFAISGECKNS